MVQQCTVKDIEDLARNFRHRLDACDNGEGNFCKSIDESLRLYTAVCLEYQEKVREWAISVFAGEQPFVAEVESAWKDEGQTILRRATTCYWNAEANISRCYEFDYQDPLLQAILRLNFVLTRWNKALNEWVSPRRSVGPSPRLPINADTVKEATKRVQLMSPHPMGISKPVSNPDAL